MTTTFTEPPSSAATIAAPVWPCSSRQNSPGYKKRLPRHLVGWSPASSLILSDRPFRQGTRIARSMRSATEEHHAAPHHAELVDARTTGRLRHSVRPARLHQTRTHAWRADPAVGCIRLRRRDPRLHRRVL